MFPNVAIMDTFLPFNQGSTFINSVQIINRYVQYFICPLDHFTTKTSKTTYEHLAWTFAWQMLSVPPRSCEQNQEQLVRSAPPLLPQVTWPEHVPAWLLHLELQIINNALLK